MQRYKKLFTELYFFHTFITTSSLAPRIITTTPKPIIFIHNVL
ncbi:MAG: hypothetical protein ACI35Y_08545 [Candidatus Limimorpha sp.]|nr:hypothetical protein [Bacteroidales bacterium]